MEKGIILKNQIFIIGLTGVIFASAAQAATIYDCNLRITKGSYISERTVIVHDENSGLTLVHDGLVYAQNGGEPIEGELVADSAKERTFDWVVLGFRNSQRQSVPAFNFRAKIGKSDGRISIRAKPIKYKNKFNASGTCEVKQG